MNANVCLDVYGCVCVCVCTAHSSQSWAYLTKIWRIDISGTASRDGWLWVLRWGKLGADRHTVIACYGVCNRQNNATPTRACWTQKQNSHVNHPVLLTLPLFASISEVQQLWLKHDATSCTLPSQQSVKHIRHRPLREIKSNGHSWWCSKAKQPFYNAHH